MDARIELDPTAKEAAFFTGAHEAVLPIWLALRERLRRELPDTGLRVQKTQIGLVVPRVYGAVSFLAVRRRTERPDPYLTVTVGLGRRLDSPRVAQATEPYPGRWTHHVLLGSPADADDELLAWLTEAHNFARSK